MVWKTFQSPKHKQLVQEVSSNEFGSQEVSEGEILSILNDVDRSEGYLNSFLHLNFDWDRQSLS